MVCQSARRIYCSIICIQFEMPNTGRTQPWQFQRDGKRLSVPVHGNLQLDHAEAMVEAALAGTALLQISSYVTSPEVARRQLQPVLTAYQVKSPYLGHVSAKLESDASTSCVHRVPCEVGNNQQFCIAAGHRFLRPVAFTARYCSCTEFKGQKSF